MVAMGAPVAVPMEVGVMGKPRSKVDDILNAIDQGLQTPEPDECSDVAPVIDDGCTRCGREVAEGSEFCTECRAFMLGDSDYDPTQSEPEEHDRFARARRALYTATDADGIRLGIYILLGLDEDEDQGSQPQSPADRFLAMGGVLPPSALPYTNPATTRLNLGTAEDMLTPPSVTAEITLFHFHE